MIISYWSIHTYLYIPSDETYMHTGKTYTIQQTAIILITIIYKQQWAWLAGHKFFYTLAKNTEWIFAE